MGMLVSPVYKNELKRSISGSERKQEAVFTGYFNACGLWHNYEDHPSHDTNEYDFYITKTIASEVME